LNHIIQRATLTETLLMGLHRSRGRSRGVGRRSRGVALAAEEFHFFDHFSVFFLKFFCAKEKNFPRACTEVAVGRAGTEGGRAGSRGLRRGRAGCGRILLFRPFFTVFRPFFTFFQNFLRQKAKFSEVARGLAKMKFPKGVVARGRAGVDAPRSWNGSACSVWVPSHPMRVSGVV